MSLQNVFKGKAVTIDSEATAVEAGSLMKEQHVGCLVVVERDGQKPVGIVTDRDLMLCVVADGKEPDSVTVEDVMCKDPITVREDQGPYEAIQLMQEQGINRLPIINKSGDLTGVVCMEDVLVLLAEETLTLSKIMDQKIVNERSDTSPQHDTQAAS
jgi:signal-transduction protein with cAMP-binding, CBS, and nucleotidyltransferase domain